MASRAGDVALAGAPARELRGGQGLGDGDAARVRRARSARRSPSPRSPATRRSTWPIAPRAYALFCIGEYREGVAICDRAIELADGDPTVGAGMTSAARYAWCHGFKGWLPDRPGRARGGTPPDRARQEDRPRAGGHRGRSASATMWSALLAYYRGRARAALVHAQQARRDRGADRERVLARVGVVLPRLGGADAGRVAAGDRGDRAFRRRSPRSAAPQPREPLSASSLLGESLPRPRRRRAGAPPRQGGHRRRGGAGSVLQSDLRASRARAGPARSAGPAAQVEIEAALARALELADLNGRQGGRAPDPRRARRAGPPARRRGNAPARAARGASPLHRDRLDRPR